ncbi:MAG: DegV family protein [Clostridioides sp.]|nr:DegV family protein [Clostridioides sp.]
MNKKIKLITDGSCDFPNEILEKIDIDIVNMNVDFGEETYLARVELDDETFFKKMRESEVLPKTSSPSPERFIEIFNKSESDEILVITISSKLSSTYSNAVLAKKLFLEKHPNIRLEVVDSDSTSIALALMVMKCAKMIEEGKTLDEILKFIEENKKELIVHGALNTLDNLIKGGRISKIAGQLINILNYKVIIKLQDGVVSSFDKARGDKNVIKKLFEHMETRLDDSKDKVVIIGHASCYDKAEGIKEHIENNYEVKKVFIASIGPIIGTYSADGAILISVL